MKDFDAYQKTYEGLPFESQLTHFRRKNLLATLDKYQPRSILEVGCANRPLFTDYAAFDSMVVLEPGAEFYENARKAVPEQARERIELIPKTLEEGSKALRSYAFDMIILSGLLHEVNDPVRILEISAELSGNQTVTHINVPNAYSFHRLLGKEAGFIRSIFDISPQQLSLQQPRIFDIRTLSELVDKCGFIIKDKGSYFIKPFTHRQMQYLLDHGLIGREILDGLDKMISHMPDLGAEIFVNVVPKSK